jgi:hypothetical protein
VTILYPDRTYRSQRVDIDKARTVNIDGMDYALPSVPYRLRGWWPFKARSLKRALFKDEMFNVDYYEGNPHPIDIMGAHKTASHTYISPSTFTMMIKESMYDKSIKSMARKNALGLSNKWLVIILAVIGVGALIAMKVFGVF